MADPIITKIGDVSAYLDAVAHGFEGTRAEFGELLANSANYAQSAESAASTAIASAATATTKAGEATTAATAAQTAKTQTEAAASQALTDIGTAESGAISAIQTEGATQTANATAQAQVAATSATTASTKASEASASATTATTKATEAAASATSAANAASAAQGVLESIPEDYSDLSEDVDQLKANLKEQDARLLVLDGKVTSEWEIGRRYLNNGAETWESTSAMMSTKRGTYINFKSGDVIVLKNLLDYQFLVGYSSDNGSTWSGGTYRKTPMTMDADAIGFICIKKLSGTFTNDEVANVAKSKIFILRGGVNIVSDNEQKIDAITMAMETFNNSEMVSIVSGLMKTWVTANSTSVVSESKFGNSITASINDAFAIKVDLSVSYPLLYTGIGIAVYEKNSSNTTIKTTYFTDISDVIEYVVTKPTTTNIIVCGYLTAESGSITTGYNEIFDYKLSVVKQTASDFEAFLTESDDVWEV